MRTWDLRRNDRDFARCMRERLELDASAINRSQVMQGTGEPVPRASMVLACSRRKPGSGG
jgi:hypothetical protein